jgi:hypothetical protein
MDPTIPTTILADKYSSPGERRRALATLREWLAGGGLIPPNANLLSWQTRKALGLPALPPTPCNPDVDERDPAEQETHIDGVVTTYRPTNLGTWRSGPRLYVWACESYNVADYVSDCIRDRDTVNRVRIVDLRKWRPKGANYIRIYVVRPGHPYHPEA